MFVTVDGDAGAADAHEWSTFYSVCVRRIRFIDERIKLLQHLCSRSMRILTTSNNAIMWVRVLVCRCVCVCLCLSARFRFVHHSYRLNLENVHGCNNNNKNTILRLPYRQLCVRNVWIFIYLPVRTRTP